MNYQEAIDFLFHALPMYQRQGKTAFKKDLGNTLALCEALGNPHRKFPSVHVAGTNGKGSCSHAIAAVLQAAGYKTGLYTSPHLKSFTERIRINGEPISEEAVVGFVTTNKGHIERIQPSFFEMTVAMAFDHFASANVDIAVIEVGLGGRLDSTNVITPIVGLITNIGLDHTDMLGETLPEIAAEKGGIMKQKVPIVIGTHQPETWPVFTDIANRLSAPLHLADSSELEYELDVKGKYQRKNLPGILKTIEVLSELGWKIGEENIRSGLINIQKLTGLKGRWQLLSNDPLTICDTGHNKEAFEEILDQLFQLKKRKIHFVLGFVNDKAVETILDMFPTDASFYFCEANVPRAMSIETIEGFVDRKEFNSKYIRDVNVALKEAREMASSDDVIFIGGSTFVVAELKEL